MILPISVNIQENARLVVRQATAKDYEILEIEWLMHPEFPEDARGFPWAEFGKEPGSAAADTWIFLDGISRIILENPSRSDETIEGFLATSVADCEDLPLSQLTGRALYVEYVAVAPWNQRGPARRHSVGPLLLDYGAVEAEERADAQLGLHALRRGPLEAWYLKQGLQDRGPDIEKFPEDPCHYFEGASDWVQPRSAAFKAKVS